MGDERKFGIGQFVRKKQPHAQLPKLAVICRKREAQTQNKKPFKINIQINF